VNNVLQNHLSKNWANISPNPERLNVATQAQVTHKVLPSISSNICSSPEVEQEVPSDQEENIIPKRAKCNSKLAGKKVDP